jgi:hypothetical protein
MSITFVSYQPTDPAAMVNETIRYASLGQAPLPDRIEISMADWIAAGWAGECRMFAFIMGWESSSVAAIESDTTFSFMSLRPRRKLPVYPNRYLPSGQAMLLIRERLSFPQELWSAWYHAQNQLSSAPGTTRKSAHRGRG